MLLLHSYPVQTTATASRPSMTGISFYTLWCIQQGPDCAAVAVRVRLAAIRMTTQALSTSVCLRALSLLLGPPPHALPLARVEIELEDDLRLALRPVRRL